MSNILAKFLVSGLLVMIFFVVSVNLVFGQNQCGTCDYAGLQSHDGLIDYDKAYAFKCLGGSLINDCQPAIGFLNTSDLGLVKYQIEGGAISSCQVTFIYGPENQIQSENEKFKANKKFSCLLDLRDDITGREDQVYAEPGKFAHDIYKMMNVMGLANNLSSCSYYDLDQDINNNVISEQSNRDNDKRLGFYVPAKCTNKAACDRLKGKILLLVEENGEAFYINPETLNIYYLGRPKDAFDIMRSEGFGIADKDIAKILPALNLLTGPDDDGDGLSNLFEDGVKTSKYSQDSDSDNYSDKTEFLNGYNPLGGGKLNIDNVFANSHKGKIFLQVENNGEAWYIYPDDGKRYFLGRPADAFSVMRYLGLGIATADFEKL